MKIRIYNDLRILQESIKHCAHTLKRYTSEYKVDYILVRQIIDEKLVQNTLFLTLLGRRDLYYVQQLQGKGNANIKNYFKNGIIFLEYVWVSY